jgi:hypothetical protein
VRCSSKGGYISHQVQPKGQYLFPKWFLISAKTATITSTINIFLAQRRGYFIMKWSIFIIKTTIIKSIVNVFLLLIIVNNDANSSSKQGYIYYMPSFISSKQGYIYYMPSFISSKTDTGFYFPPKGNHSTSKLI